MALIAGSSVGPYKIESPLGAGGMGEVYRATDTNLSRQVAIKVLPEALAADAERLARFDREAKTLAALNHPHIAAIFGLERAGTTTALIMELVEGPTLAERIAQGAIPLDEALPIALQIAKALEAAHEQGIVHRDLKPANIKVRPDGTVKVLDFGLAKAMDPVGAASSAGASLSPTITSPAMMTGAGIILGTAAYMSPEQARGKAVDKRADIWAYGAVLFEMLTGQRAFQGEDVSDTLADVMRAEPAWAKLPGSVPPALTTFLKGCLRKNPSERVRDIGDVRLALEGAFDTVVSSTPGLTAAVAPSRPLWRRALPIVALLLTTGAALAAGWYLKPVRPQPVIRAIQTLPSGRVFRGVGRQVLALSRDGRSLVYNGTGGLYLRSLDTLGDRLIAGTEDQITNPVFSPDGQALAFVQEGQIRRISLAGGSSVALASNPTGIAGMSWGSDGSILYSTREAIWQVSGSGGEPTRLLEIKDVDQGSQYVYPQRLPRGDWLLLTVFRPDTIQPTGDIVAISPATGERKLLRKDVLGGKFLSTGHLLFTDGGVLHAAPFDAKRVEVTGGAVPVVEGVRVTVGFAQPLMEVSETGTLAYVAGPVGTSRNRYGLIEASRAGDMTPMKAEPGSYLHVRATRDGRRLAVDSDDGKEAIIWIHEMGGAAAMRRLTFTGRNAFPVWSPDGQRIAFQSDRGGDLAIWMQNADGSGAAQRLTSPGKGEAHIPESWSPDGRHLSFSVSRGTMSLWMFSFDDRKTSEFGKVRSTEPLGSVFSRDGRWIAYHERPEGAAQNAPSAGVFVEPFPATGSRYQAPRVAFDFQPLWSHDGSELLYIPSTAAGQMAAVRFATKPAVEFGPPATFPFTSTAGRLSNGRRAFDVLPDGRFISLGTDGEPIAPGAVAPEIRLVFNWFEELKRLVPAD